MAWTHESDEIREIRLTGDQSIGAFMAKKKRSKRMIERVRHDASEASRTLVTNVEHKIEEFADDLGRLLGRAREKAEGWIGQRQTLAANLTEIRDTANELLGKLGGGALVSRVSGSGRRRTTTPRGARARRAIAHDTPELAGASPKKKRTMSPEARKAISDAQKARWARQRRAAKSAR
jgi:hypothetical protein